MSSSPGEASLQAQVQAFDWARSLAARRRFGARDRRGMTHLIDDAARLRAVSSIKSGRTVGLGRPLVKGPSMRGDGLPSFQMERFRQSLGDLEVGSDHVEIDCHGAHGTHLDAFNHLGLDGTWYSGFGVDEMDECGVDEFALNPVMTRAVIADVPAVRGVPWVDPHRPVDGQDIDDALAAAGVECQPGDALLLYMGRDRWEEQYGPYDPHAEGAPETTPGLGQSGAEWLAEHDVAVLGWDFHDAHHPEEPSVGAHLLIWAVGLLVIDNCDFSRLIPSARESRQWEGALVLAPLLNIGATGCTVNPVVLW